MHQKGGCFYFVTKERAWKPLGGDFIDALARYDQLLAEARGEPCGPPPFAISARELLELSRKGARQRKIPHTLSLEQVAAMVQRAGGRCEVTGIAFSGERPAGQRIRPYAPSIDRRDSAAGYHADNCRLVCAGVNVAMNRFGDEFIQSIRRAALGAEL